MYTMAINFDAQNGTCRMMEMGEIFHEDATFLENPSYFYNSEVSSCENHQDKKSPINSFNYLEFMLKFKAYAL